MVIRMIDPKTGKWIPPIQSPVVCNPLDAPLTEETIVGAILRYRNDPVLFVREVVGVEPSDQQIELLQAVAKPGAKVSVSSGHGTGKSTVLAWLVLWFLCTRGQVKIPCTAPSKGQLRDVLWSEIGKWNEKLPKWWRNQIRVMTDRVEIVGAESTRFAVARTARKENPDALQGFHADNILFLIDEAAGVHEKIFEVARGALSTPSASVVMCANPTQVTGYFYNSQHRNRKNWTCLRFSCRDSPLVDPSYVKEMEDEYGAESDVVRVRVDGLFPQAAFNQLIPVDLIEAAQKRHLRIDQYNFAPVILGVDVAPYGGDRSAVFLRQGNMSKLLWQGVGVDDMTLGGIVAAFYDEYRVDMIFVDQGAGSGVHSYLKRLGYMVMAVPFGSSSSKPKYFNKRAEMWGDLKDWLKEGGAIPQGDELRDDLVGPQYYYAPSGKLQLERKEDMKKRGLASPDLADALALTFAHPVAKREDERGYGYSGQAETVNDEWEI